MYSCLSAEIVKIIQNEVEVIRKEYHIVNPIVRNDIFPILEQLCIVLRYPLEDDEEANGIHVERFVKGEKKHFVFINTKNKLEKQVYTAAHELGHVWKIDEKVQKKIEFTVNQEDIINRFAAELLMPEKHFKAYFFLKCKEMQAGKKSMNGVEALQVILYLMDIFMVPYKAVIYRLEETGIILEEGRKGLEEIEHEYPDLIEGFIQRGNYQNLNQQGNMKSMGHLEEMLECAERQEALSKAKIKGIRQKFDIPQSIRMNETVSEISLCINSKE